MFFCCPRSKDRVYKIDKKSKAGKGSRRVSKWREPASKRCEAALLLQFDASVGGWWGGGTRAEIIIDPNPFAVGGFHAVHCARLDGQPYVAKFALDTSVDSNQACLIQLQAQQRAQYYAKEFNRRAAKAGLKERVTYSSLCVVELPERGGQRILVEPFLRGDFQKFNDNTGKVMGGELAQAFSHFSLEMSSQSEVMCDVQGIVGGTFTDAMLHTQCGEAYGGGSFGNRGRRGILDFLDTHKCRGLCKSLGLAHVQGCYAERAQNISRKRRCPKCAREKDWDAEYQACWRCDEDYLTSMQMDGLMME